jgi:cell wall-associated NlpC family hydrolase
MRRRVSRSRGPVIPGSVVAVGVVLVLAVHAAHGDGAPHGTPQQAAAEAVAYTRGEVGKPYLWGGTGPGAFDCSGLVMMAYRSAGVPGIPRTSQQQWAWGPKVTVPQAGDLVFFAGADGTPTAPGHVGIVVNPAKHLMIEAYAAGFPVRVSVYGAPGAAPGDSPVVGFTAPWQKAGAA